MRNWLNALCLYLLCLSAWADEPALQRLEANMGQGCHIAISFPATLKARLGGSPKVGIAGDPNAGGGGFTVDPPLPKSWHTSLEDLVFSLLCQDLSLKRPDEQVRFNSTTGQWEKNLAYFAKAIGSYLSDEDRREYSAAHRVTNFTAVNAAGYIITEDDIWGMDPEWRQRHLSFCLLHPPKVLCGGGVVANLRELPRGDLMPHVLDILRNIEFLPDVPTDQPPSQP